MDRPVLFSGSYGKFVTEAQYYLNLDGAGIEVDSRFGNNTKKAVINFQKKHGLVADGVIGPKTWNEFEMVSQRPYRITKFDSMTTVVSFKKEDVEKINILVASRNFETIRSMRSRLAKKPTLMFNGGLYDMRTGTALSKLIDEGKKITEGYYSKVGLYVKSDGTIGIGKQPSDTKEFLGASPTLVINGYKVIDKTGLDSGFLNNKHPRTAFVESKDEYHIVMVHGRRLWLFHYGMSCDQLANFCLIKLNAINAINFDGGGSCLLVDENGNPINYPLEYRAIANAVEVELG